MSNRTLQLDDRTYEYLLAHSLREDPALAALRAETASHPKVNMQIAPEQGQFMQMLVRLTRRAARDRSRRLHRVFEPRGDARDAEGRALSSRSTSARSITAVARRHWQAAGVADRIELVIAPASATLEARIAAGEAGHYDFAFIDADKTGYLRLLRAADETAAPGRAHRRGQHAVARRGREPRGIARRTRWRCASSTTRCIADPRIDLALLPVGDGLTLARLRERS